MQRSVNGHDRFEGSPNSEGRLWKGRWEQRVPDRNSISTMLLRDWTACRDWRFTGNARWDCIPLETIVIDGLDSFSKRTCVNYQRVGRLAPTRPWECHQWAKLQSPCRICRQMGHSIFAAWYWCTRSNVRGWQIALPLRFNGTKSRSLDFCTSPCFAKSCTAMYAVSSSSTCLYESADGKGRITDPAPTAGVVSRDWNDVGENLSSLRSTPRYIHGRRRQIRHANIAETCWRVRRMTEELTNTIELNRSTIEFANCWVEPWVFTFVM